jgi:serine/alanine adding enzyme
MQVRLYNPSDKDSWDRYVMGSGNSSCYHLIGWKDVIEKTFGHNTYYLLAEGEDGKIGGILPLVHLRSILFGNFMVSVPYFNYGGLCSDRAEIQQELLREAIRIAEDAKSEHIELRHSYKFDNGLPEKTSKVSMILELPDRADNLWNAFSSKLRSQIRRPEKEGMHARVGKEEELNSFYQVFSTNMRDLGTPVYPKKFFRNILTSFQETSWICSVYTKDDLPVASGFLVAFKDRLEIPWASSLKEYNRFGPNMLLYWSVLKFACEKGYRSFDFGRSTPGEGTFRFKEQWGSKPLQLYWHYWLKNGGSLPELNPHNPKYRLVIRVWQKLPVALTRFLGPMIVKNLP